MKKGFAAYRASHRLEKACVSLCLGLYCPLRIGTTREFVRRLPPTANISMRIHEMGLPGPESPQLPRGFGYAI
jgi:hypothetical protein